MTKIIIFLLLPFLLLAQNFENTDDTSNTSQNESGSDSTFNRWSFGILVLPTNVPNRYAIREFPEFTVYYTIEGELPKYESQLTYNFADHWHLTLNLGIQSSSLERRSEYHSWYGYGNLRTNSSEFINKINIYLVELGLKYYLMDFIEKKVSAFFTFNIGKQFAFATYEANYSDPVPSTEENNFEEFLEQINSPFLIGVGFGAEYFINHSISLSTNIRFYYSAYSGEYFRTIESNTETYRDIYKEENSEIVTRLGIGLHLYF